MHRQAVSRDNGATSAGGSDDHCRVPRPCLSPRRRPRESTAVPLARHRRGRHDRARSPCDSAGGVRRRGDRCTRVAVGRQHGAGVRPLPGHGRGVPTAAPVGCAGIGEATPSHRPSGPRAGDRQPDHPPRRRAGRTPDPTRQCRNLVAALHAHRLPGPQVTAARYRGADRVPARRPRRDGHAGRHPPPRPDGPAHRATRGGDRRSDPLREGGGATGNAHRDRPGQPRALPGRHGRPPVGDQHRARHRSSPR